MAIVAIMTIIMKLMISSFWNDLPYVMGIHPDQTELRQTINDRLQSRKHTAFNTSHYTSYMNY
jgi:hypothetical protein